MSARTDQRRNIICRRELAFTLIEILVVLVIVGIISAVNRTLSASVTVRVNAWPMVSPTVSSSNHLPEIGRSIPRR